MNTMKIHSSLYDYTVEFMDDFSAAVAQFDENTAFVIDQTVYKLYQARFFFHRYGSCLFHGSRGA